MVLDCFLVVVVHRAGGLSLWVFLSRVAFGFSVVDLVLLMTIW